MSSGHELAEPLVSCLMVTRPVPERFDYMRRSLDAYIVQTHRRTELVIVLDQATAGARDSIARHLSGLGRDDIRLVAPEGSYPLGALRNIAVAHAQGGVLCQWDDDDLHHPGRVARQLAAMSADGAQSCCLQDVMQYVVEDRVLYWTNWAATPAGAHPGTMMCVREAGIRYPETGPMSRLGEDTAALMELRAQGSFQALAGLPHLMVYVTHGSNTSPAEHHRMLVRRLGISRALLQRREARLREDLRAFDFGPAPVTVMGPNGAAFTLPAGPDRA